MSEDPRRDEIFDEDEAFGEDITFDELARGVANGTITRRRALKLFGATVVASLLSAGTAQAQTCRELGERCRVTAQCCGRLVCRFRGRPQKHCVPRRATTTTTTSTTTSTTTTS